MPPPPDSNKRPTGTQRCIRFAFAWNALLATVVLSACASEPDVINTNNTRINPTSGERILVPPGVNEPCPPSAGQASTKVPVVLIHGTFANANRAFKTLAPMLLDNQACVYAINYGKRSTLPSVFATGDMQDSAEEIRQFIDRVLQQTGARQVDLVGHSQGGTLVLYLGQQAQSSGVIRRMVAISPSVRGTTTAKMLPAETRCTACSQQAIDAPFIRALNSGPINPGRIPTLILGIDNDRVVTPVASQFVEEPAVTNVRLQQLVPGRYATHSGILHDIDAMRYVTQWLVNAD